MKKVLVTGANGAIGYHLSKRLSEDSNISLTIVDNFVNSNLDKDMQQLINKDNVNFLQINLLDLKSIEEGLAQDFDIVFHTAAMNGTSLFYEKPFEVIKNNAISTINLLSVLGKRVSERFVYFGTSESYAAGVDMGINSVPTGEDAILVIDDILNPRWSYSSSKVLGESACVASSIQDGLPFTILRIHNSFGPRMGPKHFISQFTLRAVDGDFSLKGGEQTRSFVFVEDVVSAILLSITNKQTINKIINIGAPTERKVEDVAKIILKSLGLKDQNFLNLPAPEGSVKRRCPDVSFLKSLGFTEYTDFEESIKKTVEDIVIRNKK